MSSATITPNDNDNGNPFDVPLDSEIQESAQRQAARPAKASGYVNPFDEPLASEIAEQKHAEATAQNGSYVPNARIRNLTVDPTKDVHSAAGAFFSGAATGVEAAAIPASAIGLGEAASLADPVVTSVVSHLGKVKAILDAAGKLGLTGGGIGFGIREVRELYKEFSK